MDDKNTITLDYPVKVTARDASGETATSEIPTLTFKRARACDLEVMDKYPGKIAQTIAIIAQLTGQSRQTIQALDAVDFVKAAEKVADFLPQPPATGETSSET